MEKRQGRGRPRISKLIAGEHSALYEKVITDGKQYRSLRSIADTAYVFTAASILSEAASEIEDLELLFSNQYVCRSVLNQLGRMSRSDGFSNKDVVTVAKAAIQGKKNGYSVKEIEQYIRNGRVTGEW